MTSLLLLPGDGIGIEIMEEVKRLLPLCQKAGLSLDVEFGLVGGSSLDAHGVRLTDETLSKAKASDAVLLACVGGPQYQDVPYALRPEAGLLGLRKEMQLFANLRPAFTYSALVSASSLKEDLVDGLDILIVRELTGGVYFGEPKEITLLPNGEERGIDTQVYTTSEIERVAKVAFEIARQRGRRVTSVEKRNVMQSGVLWHKVVSRVATDYPDVKLDHMLADNCGMQLVRAPKQFDVILTDNLFGDMLSDVAAMLTGSLGMLPSASLGALIAGKQHALYEPVHGSAPDIAGQGIANPIAMIASFCMALRTSLHRPDLADTLDSAIRRVLDDGLRTRDISSGGAFVSTSEMGAAIEAAFAKGLG